ncbi:protein FAM24B [Equus przewalskii]|uniref:Protein FAM24B n=1 Tax=Equus przewalskii TaxID=9798 RepID=A0ABM4QB37_EQUPR
MYCSLKFMLIVIFLCCRHSSSYEDLGADKSKVNTVIMFCIGGGILVAMLVLIGVVICLYVQVASALKAIPCPVATPCDRAGSLNFRLVSRVCLGPALNFPDPPDTCNKRTEKKNSNPMLVCVCLFLRAPMVPACLALKNNPAMVTQDKVATAITTGSYPNLQCCDECSLYADFDSLPPCFCDVNEGL